MQLAFEIMKESPALRAGASASMQVKQRAVARALPASRSVVMSALGRAKTRALSPPSFIVFMATKQGSLQPGKARRPSFMGIPNIGFRYLALLLRS